MSVIDWNAKREPWRSVGLRFCEELAELAGVFGPLPARVPTPREVAMEAGDRLRALRQEKGWSQARVAKRAGYCLATVCRYENGHGLYPEPQTKACLAQALGVSVGEIWSEENA